MVFVIGCGTSEPTVVGDSQDNPYQVTAAEREAMNEEASKMLKKK